MIDDELQHMRALLLEVADNQMVAMQGKGARQRLAELFNAVAASVDPSPHDHASRRPAAPIPSVEELVEIGRKAWHDATGGFDRVLEAVARAVSAAAPGVPAELLARLPDAKHPDLENAWDRGAIAPLYRGVIIDLIRWARSHPAPAALPEAWVRRAREIAEKLPAADALKAIADECYRFGRSALHKDDFRMLPEAAALVREIAGSGKP